MPRSRSSDDLTILQMALVGYELERQKIDDKIRELQTRIGGTTTVARKIGGVTRKRGAGKRRPLSASARKRIAAAQRRRWAEHRKKVVQSGKGEG